MRETKRNGIRLRRWGGVLVFGAAALLRLLAPGRAEALRSLLLDRAGREAVAACVAFVNAEENGWEDDGAISVFREDGLVDGGRSVSAPTHPPSPVAGCLLPVASSQAVDGGRSMIAPTHPPSPVAGCLLPVASSQAVDGGRSMIAPTHPPSPVAGCLLPVASSQAGNGGAAVCWELAP